MQALLQQEDRVDYHLGIFYKQVRIYWSAHSHGSCRCTQGLICSLFFRELLPGEEP